MTGSFPETGQKPVKKFGQLKELIRYAAAVIAGLLLVAAGIFALNFFSLSPEKIFSENYPGFSMLNLPQERETVIEVAFRQKDYKEVARLSDAKKDNSQRGKFLTAVAWTELNNNTKAIHSFNEVIAGNNKVPPPFIVVMSEYFLSLVYLRNEDYDLALELMEKIHNDPSHFYHERISRKLIRRIKMLKWR